MVPSRWFVLGCVAVAIGLFALGRVHALPVSLLGVEVSLTIFGLFAFGSFKYQIDKNALTYGMTLIAVATFVGLPTSGWHRDIASHGWWPWISTHLLSFHGLDELVHADTML